ncbi:hypothetical protein AXW83_07695 [Bosea sp. PAMC 26642]|nr:hypothetical protein AXW83_07695 [Bosea sp. PAMC 26642]
MVLSPLSATQARYRLMMAGTDRATLAQRPHSVARTLLVFEPAGKRKTSRARGGAAARTLDDHGF